MVSSVGEPAELSDYDADDEKSSGETASDNLDPNPRITNNAPSSFPLGSTIVTWTARDNSGNSASDTQRITIQDMTLR